MASTNMAIPTEKPRVAFIGLGAMGQPICSHILRARHDVAGYDVNPTVLERLREQGLETASSPSAAASEAQVLIVMVHNADQVDQVLFGTNGAAEKLPADATIWLASTVSPEYVEKLDKRLSELSLNLVDGPVSGGVTGAQDAALSIIVSGSTKALDACASVMACCSKTIYRVGDVPGLASKVKLINQLLTASHIALTAEALSLGVRSGIDPETLIEVISESAGTSRQFEKRAPRMASGDHTRHSTINIFLKDLDIALEAAKKLRFPTPISSIAHQMFTMAAGAGLGNDSDTTIIKVYEQLGGLDIRKG